MSEQRHSGTRDRRRLIEVAKGRLPADRVIKTGRVVNVFTGEILAADVAISGDRIAAVGSVAAIGPNTEVLDADGAYLVPGFIDQHSHTYESHMRIEAYAEAVVPHGTTVHCTDFYGESVVGGIEAVRLALDAAKRTPLHVIYLVGLPGYYQNMEFGHTGRPTYEDLLEMLSWPECHGLSDTPATAIIDGDEKILDLVERAQALGKHVCGHASEVTGADLQAWMAYVRNSDDHECISAQEAIEKARQGVWISMRHASGSDNVPELCKAITEGRIDSRRFLFCTDLISPVDLMEKGHIDSAIRSAIRQGLNPVTAIQMATINAAECMGLSDNHGAIAPGKYADVVWVDDLSQFNVIAVVARGRLVAREGRLTEPISYIPYPDSARNTVRIGAIDESGLAIAAPAGGKEVSVRVIEARGSSLVTEEGRDVLKVNHGVVQPDPEKDVLKIVSIERHRGSGQIGKGFVRGFGLKAGAIASTYNPQHQDLLAVGTNDRDILVAAKTLESMGGGFVVVRDGNVVESLPLPLYGLLSEERPDELVGHVQRLHKAIRSLGSTLPSPFHTLAFVGLPITIGKLKICHKGLVDVWRGQVVSVLL